MHPRTPNLHGRRRRLAVATLALAFMTAGVFHASSASAYSLSGCRTLTSITIYNGAAISKYVTATNTGISRWNNSASHPQLSPSTSSTSARVLVTGLNSAQDYWAVTGGNCAGGVYINQVVMSWNDTTVHSLSASQLSFIATHELGHVQGLADRVGSSCSLTPAVMFQGELKWSCGWGTPPFADDVNGVNSLY